MSLRSFTIIWPQLFLDGFFYWASRTWLTRGSLGWPIRYFRKYSLLIWIMNRIGMTPSSRYRISLGVVKGVAIFFESRASFTFFMFLRSASVKLCQFSEFVNKELIIREFLNRIGTLKWYFPNQISFRVVMVFFDLPIYSHFQAAIFLTFLAFLIWYSQYTFLLYFQLFLNHH